MVKFSALKTYPAIWEVVAMRKFSEEEKAAVDTATVVPNEYGLSVEFKLTDGDVFYLQLYSNSWTTPIGTKLNMNNLNLLTLRCDGLPDIYRVEITLL